LSNDLWLSDIVKRLKNGLSVGREDVPWGEGAEIGETWLKHKYFRPPSVNVRALLKTIQEAPDPPQRAEHGQQPVPIISENLEKAKDASNDEIDDMIRNADAELGRCVGQKKLWEIAQRKKLIARKKE
jgi:hypothetical protein